jgi:hypothetical protein
LLESGAPIEAIDNLRCNEYMAITPVFTLGVEPHKYTVRAELKKEK